MKFGKELTSQMVPEWQEAYMNYEFLKTVLKESFKQNNSAPAIDIESIIQNDDVEAVDDAKSISGSGDVGREYELVFFRRLDDELNKVNEFYKTTVEKAMKEAETLEKQMDALIAFRDKVNKSQLRFDTSIEMARLVISTDPSEAGGESGKYPMKIIEEEGPSNHGGRSDNSSGSEDDEATDLESIIDEKHAKQKYIRDVKVTPLPVEILNRVKLNNHLETPRSTVKNLLNIAKQTELKFSRENLKNVEAKIRMAFVEFHRKLKFLKSYRFMNMQAFSKIMKKYDKITKRTASNFYMETVNTSYFGRCDKVTDLIERVEDTFIKHFTNSNRSKGMRILRPKRKRDNHKVSFSTGFLAGCTAALILALILIIRARHIVEKEGASQYMLTMFPLYSLFGFIVLHLLLYGVDIYFCRRFRINYAFIFGAKQGTEMGYQDVFCLGFGLAVLALASVVSNLDMEMDPITHRYRTITELLPLIVLLSVIIILFCPFNIMYRSSRIFFLTCLSHCLCTPLYKVTLPDFFLADQLSSQMQSFRSLEFYICYYGWGDYIRRQHSCTTMDAYTTFYFFVSVYPFLIRLLQCLRRLFEERDAIHGFNAMKYFSLMLAVSMRAAYDLDNGIAWRAAAWLASIVAAVVCSYWDIVIDWGLLQRRSKNFLLRDKLLAPHKSVYYAAMALDVCLHFAWLLTISNYMVSFFHRQTLTSIVASMEIVRRGNWNFFRLENEHLNNVGHYRAVKSVPLPFNYDEDEDKDE